MPPIVAVTTSGALKAAIIAEFNRSFNVRYKERNKLLSKLYLEVESSRLVETHGGFESPPKVSRWRRGKARRRQAFKEFFVTVENLDWELWIGWHENDAADDQTRKLKDRARQGGSRFSQLDERIFFQLLLSSTDPDLLPSIPNAYDGLPLFSSSTRFGVAGGNKITGSGVGTPAAIRSDFISAVARMHKFQDTEGEPFWQQEELTYGDMLVMFNPDHLEKVNDAFKADTLPANPLSTASQTNLVAKGPPQLWPTQRITDDSFRVINIGTDLQPLLKQNRQQLQQVEARRDNSDEARDTKEVGVGWDARFGYGVWEPRTSVEITNS